LDICTGTGSALIPLKEKVQAQGRIVGVDFSIGMLQAGKSKISDDNFSIGMLQAGKSKISDDDSIFLVLADVAYLPFKNEAFHAVTCSHAFYELKGETQDNCLQEIVEKISTPTGRSKIMICKGRI